MICPRSCSIGILAASRSLLFICAGFYFLEAESSAISLGLKAGDIVVTQQSSGRISVMNPLTGAVTTAMSNGSLTGLCQVVLDSQNRAVAATRNTYGILRFDFVSGDARSIASAPFVQDSISLAFDLAGNLLVGSRDDWLTRVDLTTGIQEHLSKFSSSTVIQDIQVGTDGTIYVLDYGVFGSGGGRVVKVDPLSGAQQVLAQGGHIDQGSDMVIAPDGNLIVLSSTDRASKIVSVDRTTGLQQFLKSLDDTGFVALDGDGTLLFAGFYGRNVARINLTTGSVTILGSIGGVGNPTGIAVVVPEPSVICLMISYAGILVMCRRRR